MSNTNLDMYGMDEEDSETKGFETQSVNLISKGAITEIEIDGKKVSIVDPILIQHLESRVKSMQAYIGKIENDMRNIANRLSRYESRLTLMAAELDNKISYE